MSTAAAAAPPPTVSVALCVYNGAAHLAEQLDSLLAQRHAALEIIACDDGSTDGSLALLEAYAARDARIHVSRNPHNLGFSGNFAQALARCTGEYICPCDQDDVWHPDKITRLLSALGTHDLAYCDSEMTDAEGRPLGRRLSQERAMYSGHDPLVFVLSNCASGHAMLFRRTLLARALPLPVGLYHDWWLAIIAACGAGLVYCDAPLVRFRRHARTVTTLGGVRQRPGQAMRAFLEERLRLLEAMARLPSPRQADAARLAARLAHWLEAGRGLPFVWAALCLQRPLLTLLRPRLLQVARQSLKYWAALFRRP